MGSAERLPLETATGCPVFLSYNREHSHDAEEFRDRLRERGLDVFMDSVHLLKGERWCRRLQREVAQARAFILLMGSAGPRGFVLEELNWALQRLEAPQAWNAPALGIFPVCLDGVPDEAMLAPLARRLLEFQVTQWNPGQDGLPAELIAALQAALPLECFAPQHNPFKGLASFEEADAPWFFGRLRETCEVIDQLGSAPDRDGTIDREARSHHRYVLVSGDSGSGKSSLLRAGVLPRLRDGALWPRTGLNHWRIAGPLRPGLRPIDELDKALTAALGAFVPQASGDAAPGAAGSAGAAASRSAAALRADDGALVRRLAEQCPPDSGVLLIVDPFEELLPAAVEPGERQRFGRLLATALRTPSCPLYLIGTVRADALAALDAGLPELAQARNRHGIGYALPRISETGLRLSIEEPARRAGIDVSEVADLILGEARDEPGALALVQHALWSLWRRAEHRGPVTRLLRSDHEAAGGLGGMLGRDADAALAEVKREVGSDAGALRLLRRMTWVSAEDRLFRRRIERAQAEREAGEGDPQRGARVIALLSSPNGGDAVRAGEAAAHLPIVVTGNDGSGDYVELVHEFLLRTREGPDGRPVPHWGRLYAYIQRELADLKREQRLQAVVKEWRRLGPWRRWRQLASFKEQRDYAGLPRQADAAARRYLALSHAKTALLVAGVVLPLGYLGVGSALVFENREVFPINYAMRLPLWLIGLGAEPDFVRLPTDVATFDFGCDPARDTVGPLGCGGGFLPLQHAFSRPVACDMGRHEVSFEQYDRYVFSARRSGPAQPAYPAPGERMRGDLPVMEVSRAEAEAYAAWLTARSGGRQRYRLPQEWEWEYAARAGSAGPYPWADGAPTPERVNYDGGSGAPAARSIRSGEPNGFGLYNMVGNASEWVADDPSAEAGAPRYVWRGGSFNQKAPMVRVAARQSMESDLSDDRDTATNIGFRLCRER